MSKKRPLSKKLPATLTLLVLCYLTFLFLHRHYSNDKAKIPTFHYKEEFLKVENTSTTTNKAIYLDNNIDEDHQFQGCPKIAFMFLARKALPLDFLWHAFFQTGATSNFSIYVHSEPGFVLDNTTTSSTYFYGRQLNNSVKVSWGRVNMMEAEKLLLKAALQDPAIQRFVLLSDSCVPLYNFTFVYKYIMSSPRSFVDSFRGVTKGRYSLNMLPMVPLSKWRKGSQWFVLTAKHARIVANDSEVLDVFSKHCKFYGYTKFCIPDEHYVATLLALKELENGIERRTLTYTSWGETISMHKKARKTKPPAHPDTFYFEDADPKRIRKIREIDNIYVKTERRTERCRINSVPATCFLFARKFSKPAAFRLLTSGMFARNRRPPSK